MTNSLMQGFRSLEDRARTARREYVPKSRARRAVMLDRVIEACAERRYRVARIEGGLGGIMGPLAPHMVGYEERSGIAARRDCLRREHERQQGGLPRAAKSLARRLALVHEDEHGSSRGSYVSSRGIDYVPPNVARVAPYCDMGGLGMALIEVVRTTVYARSCTWRPSQAHQRLLIGRNEAGTAYAHPVPMGCGSVLSALEWIWGGYGRHIVRRQGDVAVVASRGPRMPASIPAGHVVDEDAGELRHPTHSAILLPGRGERLIVGRRASAQLGQTRD